MRVRACERVRIRRCAPLNPDLLMIGIDAQVDRYVQMKHSRHTNGFDVMEKIDYTL